MEYLIFQNLHDYGPIAVFILLLMSGMGIPIGEDLIVIPAGILVGKGEMNFWATVTAAYVGVVASDCLWYFLVSRYGTHLLHRRWMKRMIHPRRLLEAKHQMERRGAWMIVMARFIPASRTTAITVAGLLHLPFWQFLLATSVCVLFTAPMQVGIGILIARQIGTASTAELIQWIIGAVVLIIVALMAINWWRAHRRRKRRLPRAKARWLRRFRVPSVRRHGHSSSPSKQPAETHPS